MRIDQLEGKVRVSTQLNKKYSLINVFNLGQFSVSLNSDFSEVKM